MSARDLLATWRDEARVTRAGISHKRTSNGNFVNAGNFDDDGGNVNRHGPRNSNSNIGCAFSEVISKEKLNCFSFVVWALNDLTQGTFALPFLYSRQSFFSHLLSCSLRSNILACSTRFPRFVLQYHANRVLEIA